MTRREKLERRAAKRLEWASARERDGAAAQQRVHDITDRIPMGQPILVGHHSERGARADQRRIENGMRSAVDNWDMAERHTEKVAGIERQLATSIFSDDEDAPERLAEKVAKLEAKQERMKAANAAYRKEHGAELKTMSAYQRSQAVPFPSYEITNNGANVRRLKERLADIERTRTMQAAGDRGRGRAMGSRYGGTCPDCGEDFNRGDAIVWFRVTREAVCSSCAS